MADKMSRYNTTVTRAEGGVSADTDAYRLTSPKKNDFVGKVIIWHFKEENSAQCFDRLSV